MLELLLGIIVVCIAYLLVAGITGNSTLALVVALLVIVLFLARASVL